MNINYTQQDLVDVAKKTNQRIEKELPILEGLLEAIESSGLNIQLLPQAVHTLAVICPQEAYVFLEGVDSIYQELISNGKPDIIPHDLWKSLKKSASVAHKLHEQEVTEYQRQINSCRSHYAELAKDDATINVEEAVELEKPYFSHVECDISSAIKSFIFVMIMGYEPNEMQIQTLRKMMVIAKDMFYNAIERQKAALETIEHILKAE